MTDRIDKACLAALVTGQDRAQIAAFLLDTGTVFAPNAFPTTTAGAARYVWGSHRFEFPLMGVEAAGLACLMAALAPLPVGKPLRRHYLKSSAHTCTVLLTEEGAFVGAVLHGKPNVPLPRHLVPEPEPKSITTPAPARKRRPRAAPRLERPQQLDLFAEHA